ncbi:hypothetical protein ITP53_11315 [Nonomuraea sp. K274]|uniref:Scaffolding protein n=1 Tax=Nonomuraea cypriaca TaxID=1187855 RepID=A0A931A4W4_9ACTN|nr:hypothetical protein [Nonomuraea cypriaca]MBF8186327.1 hypothetical protein [Nonomuraea cypriaca]
MHIPATMPGEIIGYRKDGRPIRLIAGGSSENDTPPANDGTETDPQGDGSQQQDPPADDDAGTGDDASKGDGDASKGKSGDDLEFWKRKSRENENRAKQNKQAADKAQAEAKTQLDKIAELLGLKSKSEDPKQLADQLTAKLGGAETALREKTVELEVYRAAGNHGGDASALLDSRSFLKAVAALDPDDDGFADAVADAIKTAVKANPKLAAAETKTPPKRSGVENPGAPGGGGKRAAGLAGAISNHYGR